MIEKPLQQAEDAFTRVINVGMCLIPHEDLSDIIADDVIGFGTTKDEIMRSFQDVDDLFHSQYKQMEGLTPKVTRERVSTKISPDGKSVIIDEFLTLDLSSEEIQNTLNIRASGTFFISENECKMVHWHASAPVETVENDHWHIQEWKKEKEKLQKLVDEQTADLQRKNRELEIEAALERLRACSLSMNNSEEMQTVINMVFDCLTDLGIELHAGTIIIPVGDSDALEFWFSNRTHFYTHSFRMDYFDNEVSRDVWAGAKSSRKSFSKTYSKSIKDEYFKQVFQYSEFAQIPEERQKLVLASEAYSVANSFSKVAGIHIQRYSSVAFSAEDVNILERFTHVFDQAYTRFLDLKKAEEQARESQIELSLERIRAQVTAMRESSELLDIVVTMRKEFTSLGHKAHYFWYMRWLEETYEKAMTSGDGTKIGMIMKLPRHIHGEIPLLANWEKSSEPVVVFPMDTEDALDYIHKMVSLGDFQQIDPQAPTADDIRNIKGLTFVMARTTHGEIGFSLPGEQPKPPAESLKTLVRFASVFDLAYRRFEDLKEAEAKVRDTLIKIALERVRSRSLAMHKTSELSDVILAVHQQLGELKVNISGGAFIIIRKEFEAQPGSFWGAGGVGDYVQSVLVPYIDRPIYTRLVEGILQGEGFIEEYYSEDEKREFFKHLLNYEPFNQAPPERQAYLLSLSSGYVRTTVMNELTGIMIINHEGVRFTEEEHDVLRQMGLVFEQAYTRFQDLEKQEIQANLIREERDRLEIALNELHATQTQLIHAEKMASLGELTAGIAHEIQNPLNFVNNFSELSSELVDEMVEELDKGETEEAKAIGSDIKQNLEKINHHGKRADAIVKGMLAHSRTGKGEKELTDVNELADEFLRLSYHGLRAKDSSFNAEFKTDFDSNLPKVNVIPQDIGRVLLNLINNAFQACAEGDQNTSTERSRSATGLSMTSSEKREMTGLVQVSTRKTESGIQITVSDNGPGIPDEIKDKIFQPFFTTKPTGQGTGLGLSLSYDIVKAHGGALTLNNSKGEGCEFILSLPI